MRPLAHHRTCVVATDEPNVVHLRIGGSEGNARLEDEEEPTPVGREEHTNVPSRSCEFAYHVSDTQRYVGSNVTTPSPKCPPFSCRGGCSQGTWLACRQSGRRCPHPSRGGLSGSPRRCTVRQDPVDPSHRFPSTHSDPRGSKRCHEGLRTHLSSRCDRRERVPA